MRAAALATALVLSASAAFAQATCPTHADLAGGIELVRAEPFYAIVMTQIDGGVSEARIMAQGAGRERISTTFSHALAVTERISASETLTLEYAGDAFEMDDLPKLGTWTSAVTLLSDGVIETTGIFRATFIEAITFPIGACSYETWRVRTDLDLADSDPILQDRFFAPALEIALGTLSLNAQGTPVSGVTFDEIGTP